MAKQTLEELRKELQEEINKVRQEYSKLNSNAVWYVKGFDQAMSMAINRLRNWEIDNK